MGEWKTFEKIEQFNWTMWQPFPDPRKGQYLIAPFGNGVYQLRNKKKFEYILFGKGKNLAYRMTSLLPQPLGCGTRNNKIKRDNVLENIEDIEYRTVSFTSENEMKTCEDILKNHKIHKHNF